ncbi:short-chain dehydrogenase [Rhodococcus sp. 06-621-2]|nr:SDR family oxidoreductase [Rhodococcus sp. 06-621-2]OZC59766.1 short-chain dehydrogenase [Rhodococcus sp. 06-621-2]
MSSNGLAGKVAVVTGAGGGLGAATATRLSLAGASVVAVDLDEKRAENTAKNLPGDATWIAADVSTEEGVDAYMQAAVAAFGRVDLHHLNAGIAGSLTPLPELEVSEWDAIMSVNLRGPFLGIRSAFQHYLERGTPGSIVVTASIASLRGSNDLLAYTTSKHGVVGLIRGAAIYGGPINVRVNGVAPGIVPTTLFGEAGRADMIRRAGTSPMRRAGNPDEVAGTVAFLLSEDASYINGEVVSVDGGANVMNTARRAGGAGLWDTAAVDESIHAAQRAIR